MSNRSPLSIPGQRSNNPLDVLNENLERLTAAVLQLGKHQYVVINANTAEDDENGEEHWFVVCESCSTQAGKAVHPCSLASPGERVPPPAFSLQTSA